MTTYLVGVCALYEVEVVADNEDDARSAASLVYHSIGTLVSPVDVSYIMESPFQQEET